MEYACVTAGRIRSSKGQEEQVPGRQGAGQQKECFVIGSEIWQALFEDLGLWRGVRESETEGDCRSNLPKCGEKKGRSRQRIDRTDS